MKSLGFALLSYEEMDLPISIEAKMLLMRVRRDTRQQQAFDFITHERVARIFRADSLSDTGPLLLDELVGAKLLRRRKDGYVDVNFSQWHQTPSQKERERVLNAQRQARFRDRHRGPVTLSRSARNDAELLPASSFEYESNDVVTPLPIRQRTTENKERITERREERSKSLFYDMPGVSTVGDVLARSPLGRRTNNRVHASRS